MLLPIRTRPDISYAVSLLSRYNVNRQARRLTEAKTKAREGSRRDGQAMFALNSSVIGQLDITKLPNNRTTTQEVMDCPFHEQWIRSMGEELDSLHENKMCERTSPLSEGSHSIGSKWAFNTNPNPDGATLKKPLLSPLCPHLRLSFLFPYFCPFGSFYYTLSFGGHGEQEATRCEGALGSIGLGRVNSRPHDPAGSVCGRINIMITPAMLSTAQ